MTDRFEAGWLAAREPFDEAALDRGSIAAIRAWAAGIPSNRPMRVVDLGSGTGVALRRATTWLAGRPIEAFAVDSDAELLAQSAAIPVLGDLLRPLSEVGGPEDGTVDLVLGHAVADLVPLDALAARVAALVRPGGLIHLALTYDGETVFSPSEDPSLDSRMIDAYHRHMDLRAGSPAHGGSTAGRRLAPELERAGLRVLRSAPSTWKVTGKDRHARIVFGRMLRFITDGVLAVGGVPTAEVYRWDASRRRFLDSGELRLQVRHVDVVAQRWLLHSRPIRRYSPVPSRS
jgi:SAM-dependent methyltransferase